MSTALLFCLMHFLPYATAVSSYVLAMHCCVCICTVVPGEGTRHQSSLIGSFLCLVQIQSIKASKQRHDTVLPCLQITLTMAMATTTMTTWGMATSLTLAPLRFLLQHQLGDGSCWATTSTMATTTSMTALLLQLLLQLLAVEAQLPLLLLHLVVAVPLQLLLQLLEVRSSLSTTATSACR